MADLQKSASSPALMNAGAAMSHVPKRATQHALFLASWEVPPACLKPGQATAGSRVAPWQKYDGMTGRGRGSVFVLHVILMLP